MLIIAPSVSRINFYTQVAPDTVHPAFEKAGHYFGVKVVKVPMASDYTCNVEEYEKVNMMYCVL